MKIKLGTPPKTFPPIPVKFTMPDGTEGIIKATYKYRTRSDFGAFQNAVGAVVDFPRDDKGNLDFKSYYEALGAKGAAHLLDAIDSWDVEGVDLTAANLEQLGDEMPAATGALMSKYRDACVEGHLGN